MAQFVTWLGLLLLLGCGAAYGDKPTVHVVFGNHLGAIAAQAAPLFPPLQDGVGRASARGHSGAGAEIA